MNEYIGITVGPVFSTMAMTSTPAGLWVASYMFSCLTASVCEELIARGVKEEQIISPYFSSAQEKQKNGVGQYHDRIIVRVEGGAPSLSLAAEAIDAAKQRLAFLLQTEVDTPEETEQMLLYIRRCVRAVAFSFSADENESSYTASEKLFDSIELCEPIPDPMVYNPLLRLFDGRLEGNARNWRIKNSHFFESEIDAKQWQLYENGMIRTMQSIAGDSKMTQKIGSEYCAILRSDGDNMGKLLAQCTSDELQRSFSAHCLEYCKKLSEVISDYGGVTIYAGGDDLMAIVPLLSFKKQTENGRSANLFDLVLELKEINRSMLASFCVEKGLAKEGRVTVSFGVSVIPHNYPLQTALSRSSHMLFNVAKEAWKSQAGGKNSTAISVGRSSGRVAAYLMKNESLLPVLRFIDFLYEHPQYNDLLSPAINKIQEMKASFSCAFSIGKTILNQTYKRTFFQNYQRGKEFYDAMLELSERIREDEQKVCVLDQNKQVAEDDSVLSLLELLNTIYLLITHVGDEE